MSKRNRGAKKMMKNDENGQLSCGICSYPAAARSPLQGWVGDRCRDRLMNLFWAQVSNNLIKEKY